MLITYYLSTQLFIFDSDRLVYITLLFSFLLRGVCKPLKLTHPAFMCFEVTEFYMILIIDKRIFSDCVKGLGHFL